MAVIVEAWEVIARRTAVEERFPGGVQAWCGEALNRTACADRSLCRIGFMAERDASEFMAHLERLGLRGQEGGAYQEVALVRAEGPWQHGCAWLTVGVHATLTAAWLTATDPDPLVVPISWRPGQRIFHLDAAESARRLRFLRRDGEIEVYLDTETGKEVYRGRTMPPAQLTEDAERRFRAACDAVKPFLTYDGHPRKFGWFERRRLRKGIGELEALTATDGEAWRVFWMLGMACRAAADPSGAHRAFKRAYDVHPTHPEVAREYAGQCMALGKGDEAVAVSKRTCAEHPEDAGLRSNLALAWVIAGDMKQALAEAERARSMDPADPVTRALEGMIQDVIAGRRPRLTKYP